MKLLDFLFFVSAAQLEYGLCFGFFKSKNNLVQPSLTFYQPINCVGSGSSATTTKEVVLRINSPARRLECTFVESSQGRRGKGAISVTPGDGHGLLITKDTIIISQLRPSRITIQMPNSLRSESKKSIKLPPVLLGKAVFVQLVMIGRQPIFCPVEDPQPFVFLRIDPHGECTSRSFTKEAVEEEEDEGIYMNMPAVAPKKLSKYIAGAIAGVRIDFGMRNCHLKEAIVIDNPSSLKPRKIFSHVMPTVAKTLQELTPLHSKLDPIVSAIKPLAKTSNQAPEKFVKMLKQKGFRLIAIDFDQTLVEQGQPNGILRSKKDDIKITEDSIGILNAAAKHKMVVYIVSFQNDHCPLSSESPSYGQPKPVEGPNRIKIVYHYPSQICQYPPRETTAKLKGPQLIAEVVQRTTTLKPQTVNILADLPNERNGQLMYAQTKNYYLDLISEYTKIDPNQILLIDDNMANGLAAMLFGYGFLHVKPPLLGPENKKAAGIDLQTLDTVKVGDKAADKHVKHVEALVAKYNGAMGLGPDSPVISPETIKVKLDV